jgi:hypothetical protein
MRFYFSVLKKNSISIEKLVLQVPWKNLYNQPTKATIDGLYLLVVPETGLFNFGRKKRKLFFNHRSGI